MNDAAASARQALREGDAQSALQRLTEQVRARPQDARLRVFLFQLLCVLGQWDRALNQLKVAAELDAGTLAMAQTYREAIACEALRQQVFAGHKVPMLFGEPEAWMALLIEALLREGRGEPDAAQTLRAQALEQAPASAGTLTVGEQERPFEWIADADSRLGPVIEAVVNGRYYWLPISRLSRVDLDPPEDLRDAVWTPAHFQFSNGGEVVGLIPTRYPATDLAAGDSLALARRTEWVEASAGQYVGRGQRLLATDADEFALMDLRSIVLRPADPADLPSDPTLAPAGAG
jgi:type VI secretion system protein ImpE